MPPSSAARPKRGGEAFARAHEPEHAAKKPRFDRRNPSTLAAATDEAEEPDAVLEADVIGRAGAQPKRNAVNIDGYESDSEGDTFAARAAGRGRRREDDDGGGGRSKDEEDDDMFADLEETAAPDGDEDEDLAREGKKSKKDVRFLDAAEIEGQVMHSKSGGHVPAALRVDGDPRDKRRATAREGSAESSSSSGADEERAAPPDEMEEELAAEVGAGGKKRHAPRLDAFNLKEEEEEGRYDEAGNFVRRAADPDAANDGWLEGLSKKDVRRAREAQERRDVAGRRQAAAADAALTSDLLATLIAHLDPAESPLEALQRLNRAKPKDPKALPKWKQKNKKKQTEAMDADHSAAHGNGASPDPAETARKKAVEAITGAADALYSRAQHDIYEAERELLMRQYRRETGDDWRPRPDETATATTAENDGAPDGDRVEIPGAEGGGGGGDGGTWEYRWSDARDGGEPHGPYDGATMKAWSDAGYFGDGVEFRRGGDGGGGGGRGEWRRVLDVG